MTDGHFPASLEPRSREMNLTSSYYMISNLIIKVPVGLPGAMLTSRD